MKKRKSTCGSPMTMVIKSKGPRKEKGIDGKECWDGYKIGNPATKMKDGERVDNCVEM